MRAQATSTTLAPLSIDGGGTVSTTFRNGWRVRFTLGGSATRADAVTSGTFGGTFTTSAPGDKEPADNEGVLRIRCIGSRRVGRATEVFMVATARSFDVTGPNGDAYIYIVDDPAGDRMWSGRLDTVPSTSPRSCPVPAAVNTFGTVTSLAALAKHVSNGNFTVRR